jgi:outer membrane protein OmpA-like peptidoglycan-associated protein
MAGEDWAIDVKKYVPDADDGIIAGIVKYCGIALRTTDASLVAFSDPKETARVRDGYCRKKLALTESDAEVDAAIAEVGERMKADRTKNRVTVYYLLAEKYGKLGLFAPKGAAAAKGATTAGAAVAAASVAAAPPPPPAAAAPAAAPAPAAPPTAAPAAAATVATLAGGAALAGSAAAATGPATPAERADRQIAAANRAMPAVYERQPSVGFVMAATAGVVGIFAMTAIAGWFISGRNTAPDAPAPQVAAAAPAPAPAPAPVVAPPPPEGAGIVATEVAGRPKVSVFFETARADIATGFEPAVAPILAWLRANPGDMAQVSGFNDPRGNAEFNADLSRRRAEGVAAELRRLGVPENQLDLEPPASATDATTDLAGARRVEITVVPLS